MGMPLAISSATARTVAQWMTTRFLQPTSHRRSMHCLSEGISVVADNSLPPLVRDDGHFAAFALLVKMFPTGVKV